MIGFILPGSIGIRSRNPSVRMQVLRLAPSGLLVLTLDVALKVLRRLG